MISKFFVIFVAFGFTMMGFMALTDPEGAMAYMSAGPLGDDMRNEARAVYGGFGFAVGGLLAYTLWDGVAFAVSKGVRLGMAVIIAGMALGRAVSWIVDGGTSMTIVVFFVGEVLMPLMLLASIRLDGRRPDGSETTA